MTKESLFSLVFSPRQAALIVEQVKNSNFSRNRISALFAGKSTRPVPTHKDNKVVDLFPKAA